MKKRLSAYIPMRLTVNKLSGNHRENQSLNPSKAFSLIEILVVTAITGLLVTIILHLTLNILNVWNQSNGLGQLNRQAQLALNLLARDLESSVMRSDGNEWLRAVREDWGENNNRVTEAAWLMFFSQLPDRDRESQGGDPIYGDICAVSYRLGYQNPLNPATEDSKTVGLFRTVMDAETTFIEALDLSSRNESYFRDFWHPRASQTVKSEHLIISNLVEFRLKFTYRDAMGALQQWDANKDFIFGGPEGNVEGYLIYVDIIMKVLNTAADNYSKTIDRDQLILNKAQTFHRRVLIPSYPF